MKWIWISYPVISLVIMITASSYLLGPGQDYFQNVQAKKEKLEETEKKLNNLNKKLSILNKADEDKLKNDLKTLTEIMPPRRDIWSLMNQLTSAAASGSGAKLIGYKGSVGDVREASYSGAAKLGVNDFIKIDVTYELDKFENLPVILNKLSQSLPLLRVVGVEYEGNEAVINVEGAWSNWEKVTGRAEDPLPEGYEAVLGSVLTQTNGYQNMSTGSQPINFNYVSNPF